MSPIEHETLIQYGHAFQVKAVASIVFELNFFEQIQDILDENFFDSEYHQWIVAKTKWYYGQYKKSN